MHQAIHLIGSIGYVFEALLGLSLLVQGGRQPARRPLELVAFLVIALGGALGAGVQWYRAGQSAALMHSDWDALWASLGLVGFSVLYLAGHSFRRRRARARCREQRPR